MNDHVAAAKIMAHQCLCFRARRVSRAITRVYDEALRPSGIHATQLTLLNAIALGGPYGQQMSTLITVLALDKTTLTRNIKVLEKDGLVEKRVCAKDARSKTLVLTDIGQRRVAQALELWNTAHESLLELMGEQLSKDIHAVFDAVAEKLE